MKFRSFKKTFRCVLLENAFGKCIFPKCMQKNPFLYPPCEERNPHMLVEDLMLIESDSVQFLLLSPCVSIVPSSWTKARETREQKAGNGSTCTAALWKRQHLHCASLASQFCTGKPNGLHQRRAEIVARQYVHAITQVNAAEQEQDILENQPCERTHMARRRTVWEGG